MCDVPKVRTSIIHHSSFDQQLKIYVKVENIGNMTNFDTDFEDSVLARGAVGCNS